MQSPGVHVEEQLWNTIIPQHAPTWHPHLVPLKCGKELTGHVAGLADTYI